MIRIKLRRGVWHYDPDTTLGTPGSFGTVFCGSSEAGQTVAVKRLNPDVGQHVHREQKIVEQLIGKNFNHVVPILDAGQDTDSDSYFVVMSLAERSLQDDLNNGKTWRGKEAAVILLQICQGLSEVPEIVHRDLKPANILYHEGKWKVADFGIARLVEESTSVRTLKDCLTWPYGAPEQWRGERATGATDVYALACIGYAILTGSPPYKASQKADFREQHLNSPPPPLTDRDPQLCIWLTMMLRKEPKTRPARHRVCDFLEQYCQNSQHTSTGGGLDALAHAGHRVAQKASEEEARLQSQKAQQDARRRLAVEGCEILQGMVNRMFEDISKKVPNVDNYILNVAPRAETVIQRPRLHNLRLGLGILSVGIVPSVLPQNAFHRSGWDVITGVSIAVKQEKPQYSWSASLWYRQTGDDGYRWWEASYYDILQPLAIQGAVSLIHDVERADEVAKNSLGPFRFAEGPKPIDGADFNDFCDRWSLRLAKASQGQLEHPRYLPLD